ncbi:MAG: hypothetical protein WC709_10975 [Thermoleophilia bacterium]
MNAGRARSAPAVEGCALETHDGLIFTVKGLLHPPGRTIAYLRYVPDPAGDRCREGLRYRRVYRFADQLEELRARGLEYVVDDAASGVRLQSVPDADVHVVYDPSRRLRQLADEGPGDALEAAALSLCELVRGEAGVGDGALGVTGSLLFGLQNAASDLDLVVYGEEGCRAVHGALRRLMGDPRSPLQRPGDEELAAIAARHREDTPISAADFVRLQARKVNEGRFEGRPCFVRFVKRPGEVPERYGDQRYEPLRSATIRARVDDASEALFTPCRYGVAEVTREDGAPAPGLCEIVSFRGRFADQARRGEWVRAHGALERVVRRDGPVTARLTVGGAPGDFLVSAPG